MNLYHNINSFPTPMLEAALKIVLAHPELEYFAQDGDYRIWGYSSEIVFDDDAWYLKDDGSCCLILNLGYLANDFDMTVISREDMIEILERVQEF